MSSKEQEPCPRMPSPSLQIPESPASSDDEVFEVPLPPQALVPPRSKAPSSSALDSASSQPYQCGPLEAPWFLCPPCPYLSEDHGTSNSLGCSCSNGRCPQKPLVLSDIWFHPREWASFILSPLEPHDSKFKEVVIHGSNLESRVLLVPSPDDTIGFHSPISPLEDLRKISEQLIRIAKSL
ncbi:UNVERIFIED_CONTAM: hypothetical protein K2H54_063118 [Gekko kuhli]